MFFFILQRLNSYFYPRSPCGERHLDSWEKMWNTTFLSTLSLRRATLHSSASIRFSRISIHALLAESDGWTLNINGPLKISIHALLAESDVVSRNTLHELNISIHALLAESDSYSAYLEEGQSISIHALLAESDCSPRVGFC